MKLEMAKDSLFAVLLRSPWWMSLGVAAGFAALARLVLPEEYRLVGSLTALPFLVIAAMVGWKRLRAPSTAHVATTLETAGSLSWREFSSALEEAFRSDGYAVTRLDQPAADFRMVKAGRTSLVACKRWKAASTGVPPLRELHAAGEAVEADECVYVSLGEITDNARRFATEQRIRLLQGTELAQLLRGRLAIGKRGA